MTQHKHTAIPTIVGILTFLFAFIYLMIGFSQVFFYYSLLGIWNIGVSIFFIVLGVNLIKRIYWAYDWAVGSYGITLFLAVISLLFYAVDVYSIFIVILEIVALTLLLSNKEEFLTTKKEEKEKKMKSWLMGVLAVIGVLFFISIFSGNTDYNFQESTVSDTGQDELAITSFYYYDYDGSVKSIDITNYEDTSLTSVKLTLNSRYSYNLGTLQSGQKKEIILSMFKDSNGNSFPRDTVPIKLKVISSQGTSELPYEVLY